MVLLLAYGLFSCSNLKYLPAGDALYTGAKVTVKDTGRLRPKRRKALQEQMESLVRPKPNSKILGMRLRLTAYNIAGHPKKEKSPRGWLKNKVGEPPVLLSDVDLQRNIQVLQSAMENSGFFRDSVSGDTIVKKRLASARYDIMTGPRYRYRNVAYSLDSSDIGKALAAAAPRSLLKTKRPFSLARIKAERERADSSVKEKGFYFFNPDFLVAKADTAVGNHGVDVTMKLKPGIPEPSLQSYRINNIYVFAGYSIGTAGGPDTTFAHAVYYEGLNIVDKRNLYRPILFGQSILFTPHELYKQSLHDNSLNRLITLGLFKFVKNRFEVVPGIDSPRLNVYYYLTPRAKKSLNFEVTGTTKSNNLAGSQVSVGWKNRNAFKAGELLSINLLGGFEVQYGGSLSGYNTYRGSIETKLSIPRFIVPFYNLNTKSGFVPKTNILLAYDVLNKQKLFTLYSLRSSYGYAWKESARKEHVLNPINIQFVHPFDVTPAYNDSASKYPTLRRAIEPQFIIGATYSYTYNQLTGRVAESGWYLNGNADVSGNAAGLIIPRGSSGKRAIFGYDFAQYLRFDADLRRYIQTGKNSVWASRIMAGFGLPYGNSIALPFVKQYFVGGNNSIRAFRSMAIGPGIVSPPGISSTGFYPTQTGDIKLEGNTELRAKLFSVVHGAIFIDAGNVWLYNRDTALNAQPGGQFTKEFLKQLAVGAGVGLRFDISFLVLRLDLAIPLRIPYLPEGQRWVINKIDFGDRQWRRDNLILNLAIGYPF